MYPGGRGVSSGLLVLLGAVALALQLLDRLLLVEVVAGRVAAVVLAEILLLAGLLGVVCGGMLHAGGATPIRARGNSAA